VVHYTLDDIRHAIPSPYFERGAEYQRTHRVLKVSTRHDGQEIAGTVQGAAAVPYRIVAYVKPRTRATPLIHGVCSCPVGANCKHVAAVLIESLAEPPPAAPAAPSASEATAALRDQALLEWMAHVERAAQPAPVAEPAPEGLFFLLRADARFAPARFHVELVSARRLKGGGYGKTRAFRGSTASATLAMEDRRLLGWLQAASTVTWGQPALQGKEGARLLRALLETGRCHWRDRDRPALTLGEARDVTLRWTVDADGTQRLRGDDVPGQEILALEPPWYVDTINHICGPVRSGLPDALAAALLHSPAVTPAQAARVQQTLARLAPDTALPLPRTFSRVQHRRVTPIPCLYLFVQDLPVARELRWKVGTDAVPVALARLSFDYDGATLRARSVGAAITRVQGEQLLHIARDAKTEDKAWRTLLKFGFAPLGENDLFEPTAAFADDLAVAADADPHATLLAFGHQGVGQLRAKGWRIEFAADYPYRVVEAATEWYADVEEGPGNDWFDLELGVLVNGKRVGLLPVLLDLLRQLPEDVDPATLGKAYPEQVVYAHLEDGALLPLPLARIAPLLASMVELFDAESVDGTRLRLPNVRAAHLAALESSLDQPLAWSGGEQLRELGRKLNDFQGVREVAVPAGLHAELRDYQRHGLNWLQFLREYELGGLLADDMGLGKTLQALAHLLVEKASGRMDRPSLVVAPTSLMVNWRLEAERFAPDLRVLVLQGTERKEHFEGLAAHDVVLTTYPLLPRDQAILMAQDYHLLILDEAQMIKNPKAKASQIVRQLRARHRLCLSGTPMENHLGELWSLFHFLMPGLLGDEQRFRRTFRTPIERHGDTERRAALKRRVAPFMLRRNKQEVAPELPPKTEIVRRVELNGAQRDLYETLRLAMHAKVRQEIGRKGMARSTIVILDALLKLRQICCDPRLLKLEAARKVKGSAKLDMLMEMLPALVEEGQRILVFSQFTSMLALIEAELIKAGLKYVQLTGDTVDRATPIKRFQAGDVPLFLISLKAGGTGLNLTAADTVIHYDPWWNPAVENQATDRAHRIGQDKSVFVYKLLTVGTVEEKILDMQTRKHALMQSLFSASGQGATALTADDLNALFEPL
jgi:superfamily II DNA or RNA helicase